MCLKSFTVRHGLGVDFLVEADDFFRPYIFPLIFWTLSKAFLVTKQVAVGAAELYRGGFCRKFQAGADYEVKSAEASYI